MIRLDIGGGTKPREGFMNVDLLDCADYRIDLDKVDSRHPLPFEDDDVEEVYSSHCFEHLHHHQGLLHEIVRVCRLGARVEIRVPHPFSQMAMCAGHVQVLSEDGVTHWREFPDAWWPGCERWLSAPQISYEPTKWFDEARDLFPALSREQILRFIPGTCHETRFVFTVEKR